MAQNITLLLWPYNC